jgi:hypothetical protein
MGTNGWYTSDVGVSFSVSDDESPFTTAGCDAVTVTTDTDGVTFTCTATSDGGEASASVTVKRDATDPTVAYAGNAGSYDVAEAIGITCTADDNLSGIATDSCADISGFGWEFALGTNSFSAEATDNAGNEGSGSTSFEVAASFDGVCAVVGQFVDHKGIANSLCAKLRAAAKAKKASSRNGSLNAFINEVTAQTGKKIPEDGAAVLIALAKALMG